MNNCNTCRYWGTGNDDDNEMKDKLRPCSKVKMLFDSTEWSDCPVNDWDTIRTLKDKYKDDKAFVQDGSDYKATLYVMEDFGCVHFKEGK